MSEHVYFLTLGLILGTIVLVFGMRALSAYMQAKARADSGEAYRQIAEKAVAVQSESAISLSSIQESLADIRSRLASVEKILKEVE
jgi:uncharacterized protein YaiL (DUF2058 family)